MREPQKDAIFIVHVNDLIWVYLQYLRLLFDVNKYVVSISYN